MLTAAPQHPSPVPTITILDVPCPYQEPCVTGQSALLCDSCLQLVVDALNASDLGLDDFFAATLLRISSIHMQMPHQSPPPIPVLPGPTSLDTVGHPDPPRRKELYCKQAV
ncbi:MAG: hypothetical protein J3Q66DRAFT_367142 [Benniella sp.]|nr:MAG: hypothetical protein J3Q66DRAFT_367142 [Benniella sp.]